MIVSALDDEALHRYQILFLKPRPLFFGTEYFNLAGFQSLVNWYLKVPGKLCRQRIDADPVLAERTRQPARRNSLEGGQTADLHGYGRMVGRYRRGHVIKRP